MITVTELLKDMLDTYKEVANFEMSVNDDPVTSADVEFGVEEVPVPGGHEKVEMLKIMLVVNGVEIHKLSKVLNPEDDLEAIKEDMAADFMLSIFGSGVNLFRKKTELRLKKDVTLG